MGDDKVGKGALIGLGVFGVFVILGILLNTFL